MLSWSPISTWVSSASLFSRDAHPPQLIKEGGAEPAPTVSCWHERKHRRLGTIKLDDAGCDRDEIIVLESRQARVGACGPHPRSNLLTCDRLVGNDEVAEREPRLELILVSGRASRTVAALIDSEEDRTPRAMLVGMLREADDW